ncbi:ankyrin repeat-containing protein BDA1-like [Hibiscus syriacus]|uniref:ankyrin repeat-containing protein BDA1-like n=1 Tax=Hibiscus syriacus TaxID=106335 RepID=UPI001923B791|nr:ankyrin repeat-containing protein BDA1-like [Hibiscus syriacus]
MAMLQNSIPSSRFPSIFITTNSAIIYKHTQLSLPDCQVIDMESRLFEAVRVGDVSAFHSLLKEDPFLLDRVALNSVCNPLHVSALSGQVEVTKEVLIRKPEFAREIDENGLVRCMLPQHGHIEIVRELVRVGYDICLQKGAYGKVPLHCAALKGRVEVVKELVHACPESIKQVTVRGETVLQLAVTSNQIDVARVLIEETKRLQMMEVLNWEDIDGNTVLHQATFNRQHEQVGTMKAREISTNPTYIPSQTATQCDLRVHGTYGRS